VLRLRQLVGLVLNQLSRFDQLYRNSDTSIYPELNFPIDETNQIVVFSCFGLTTEDVFFLNELAIILKKTKIYVISNKKFEISKHVSAKFEIHFRRNISRDLGIIRDFSLIYQKVPTESNILFINSSCFWNPLILSNFLSELQKVTHEVVFGTNSFSPRSHVQTYFIWVGKEVSRRFTDVLSEKLFIGNWQFKRTVVYLGEKKIATKLLQKGIKVSTLFSALKFADHNRFSGANISLDNSNQLISAGAPFCKKIVSQDVIAWNYLPQEQLEKLVLNREIFEDS
jgi:hypothetical protein